MNPLEAIAISVVLLVCNGFFVAAEFALVASKAHRLQDAAKSGSRTARAALASTRQLSLMLAGAQLGITLCSLGLGSLAEPAIASGLTPLFHAIGLPTATSHVIAFVLALMIVVFLHMVVGEMAPKSWAIGNPERSATLLALPFRAFTLAARPILKALNVAANGFVRLCRVEPQDELVQAHGPADLRMLIEHSKEHGLLPEQQYEMLSSALQVHETTVQQVMIPRTDVITANPSTPVVELERLSAQSGRSRITVTNEQGVIIGILHIRDAIRATTSNLPATAHQLMTKPFTVDASATVAEAVSQMQLNRSQLAIVGNANNKQVGIVALEDLLEELLGEFDDETDVPRSN